LKRVIIDTDPGIDDAAAILLALTSPELSLEAITTVYGNGPVDTCTDNVVRILLAAGRLDIPVHKGAGKPLLRTANEGWALDIHGSDVMGGAGYPLSTAQRNLPESRHASLEIIGRVMDSPGEVTIIALGRLTNVALALSLELRLVQSVAEIIVMGCAVSVPGNVSPVASANLYEDPEAAAIVYSSGVPLVQVGLDVCNRVTIDQGQLDLIQQAGTPTTRLLAAATPYLQRPYVDRGLLKLEVAFATTTYRLWHMPLTLSSSVAASFTLRSKPRAQSHEARRSPTGTTLAETLPMSGFVWK